jgi:hypothetical protein
MSMSRFRIVTDQREGQNGLLSGRVSRHRLTNTPPTLSAVDRWSSNMGGAKLLEHLRIETKRGQHVLVQLPERGIGVVNVELCGSQLFVLITTQDRLQQRIRDYYCQLDLSVGVIYPSAIVELTDFVLTVTFDRPHHLVMPPPMNHYSAAKSKQAL